MYINWLEDEELIHLYLMLLSNENGRKLLVALS